MLARLAPQSQGEQAAVKAAGLDTKRILNCDEIVTSNKIFFAATGITHSIMLGHIDFRGSKAFTHSMVVRGETGTLRNIRTSYNIGTLSDE
jgi:fructose-1,6-bisphosphatase II